MNDIVRRALLREFVMDYIPNDDNIKLKEELLMEINDMPIIPDFRSIEWLKIHAPDYFTKYDDWFGGNRHISSIPSKVLLYLKTH